MLKSAYKPKQQAAGNIQKNMEHIKMAYMILLFCVVPFILNLVRIEWRIGKNEEDEHDDDDDDEKSTYTNAHLRISKVVRGTSWH